MPNAIHTCPSLLRSSFGFRNRPRLEKLTVRLLRNANVTIHRPSTRKEAFQSFPCMWSVHFPARVHHADTRAPIIRKEKRGRQSAHLPDPHKVEAVAPLESIPSVRPMPEGPEWVGQAEAPGKARSPSASDAKVGKKATLLQVRATALRGCRSENANKFVALTRADAKQLDRCTTRRARTENTGRRTGSPRTGETHGCKEREIE